MRGMKSSLLAIALVAVLVVAVWSTSTRASPAAVHVAGAARVVGIARFREQQFSYSSLGTFQGATEVWRTRVYLLGKQQANGYGSVACIHVDATIRICAGVYALQRGQVFVRGQITMRKSFRMSVSGGTGAYAGATGTLDANGTPEARALVFNFGP